VIYGGELKGLAPGSYFNDVIIQVGCQYVAAPLQYCSDYIFLFSIISYRLSQCNRPLCEKVAFFNSFFYAKMEMLLEMKDNFMKKWTDRLDLLSREYFIIPLHSSEA
jgi:Ulp1 family protease